MGMYAHTHRYRWLPVWYMTQYWVILSILANMGYTQNMRFLSDFGVPKNHHIHYFWRLKCVKSDTQKCSFWVSQNTLFGVYWVWACMPIPIIFDLLWFLICDTDIEWYWAYWLIWGIPKIWGFWAILGYPKITILTSFVPCMVSKVTPKSAHFGCHKTPFFGWLWVPLLSTFGGHF